MNQLKNILVAVDFSGCSKAALTQAIRIASWNGARLHALHVIEPLDVADVEWARHVTHFDANNLLCRQAQGKLTAWVAEAGGQAEVRVVVGTPIHEVLTQVKAVSADLLVAGACGSSAPILGAGTLATKLARKAPTKLLLVSEGGTAPFRKVVVCVDFSPASALAVEQATRVAGRETGEIHCLHVFDPPWRRPHYRVPTPEASQDFQKQYTDALQGRLEEFVDQHEGFNLRCVLFPWSSYGQGIAQYANEVKADLVILGTRGHTSLRYILLGSTAERLLRELPCSVLTVLPPDAESIHSIP
jgi:nucleotide-binding universal stress UspA family protein